MGFSSLHSLNHMCRKWNHGQNVIPLKLPFLMHWQGRRLQWHDPVSFKLHEVQTALGLCNTASSSSFLLSFCKAHLESKWIKGSVTPYSDSCLWFISNILLFQIRVHQFFHCCSPVIAFFGIPWIWQQFICNSQNWMSRCAQKQKKNPLNPLLPVLSCWFK